LHIEKIISGGQTGVDRAALDFAISRGIAHGGWCPAGRRAADGVLDPRYALTETESAGYRQRTKQNVLQSDGTLIIYWGELAVGSRLTQGFARQVKKPVVLLNAADLGLNLNQLTRDLLNQEIRTLNIAGPSEGRCPGIYKKAVAILLDLWDLRP